jgi:hypothetical protein
MAPGVYSHLSATISLDSGPAITLINSIDRFVSLPGIILFLFRFDHNPLSKCDFSKAGDCELA